jgi:hypothetical protein
MSMCWFILVAIAAVSVAMMIMQWRRGPNTPYQHDEQLRQAYLKKYREIMNGR